MRTRALLLALGVASMTTAFILQACDGDTTENPTSPGDAAPDVVVEAATPKDTGPAQDPDAGCDTTNNFTDDIPDSSIADGASTSGICVACANSKCKAAVQACNADCPCQNLAGEALECYLKNPSNPIVCAGNFAGVNSTTQGIGFTLIQCLQNSCKQECATDSLNPDAGRDAGDGGDGG